MIYTKLIWLLLYVSILLFYPTIPTKSISESRLIYNSKNLMDRSNKHSDQNRQQQQNGHSDQNQDKNNDNNDNNNEDDDNNNIQITDPTSIACGDWEHVCISIEGLILTGNPEINDIYCLYECDVNNYIKFQSQTDCSFYIKWIPNHYIIYSYSNVRYGTISNHLFGAARDCNIDLNGYQHLSTCKYWNTFDTNDELVKECNVTVNPNVLSKKNQCTTPTGIHVSMDKGEIAAIIIIVLALFVVAFGGAMRYH